MHEVLCTATDACINQSIVLPFLLADSHCGSAADFLIAIHFDFVIKLLFDSFFLFFSDFSLIKNYDILFYSTSHNIVIVLYYYAGRSKK